MGNFASILIIFLYLIPAIVGTVGVSEVDQQRSDVRAIWEQALRDMSAQGYLSPETEAHYTAVLQSKGFTQTETFFNASHRSPASRAQRPIKGQVSTASNEVTLTLTVRPTRGYGEFCFYSLRMNSFSLRALARVSIFLQADFNNLEEVFMEFFKNPIVILIGLLFLLGMGGFLLFGDNGLLGSTTGFFRRLIQYTT